MRRDEVERNEPDSGVFALVEVARNVIGQLSPEQYLRGELTIGRYTNQARTERAFRLSRVPVIVAIILAFVITAFALRRVVKSDNLSYIVEIGTTHEAQPGRSSGVSASVLNYPDGMEIRLSKGTLARGDFASQNGPILAIDRGQMQAKVVHSSKSERWFDAGPFSVRTTGAVFDLDWQPQRDKFDLRVESGSVSVTAPAANDPIPVRAGQWLTIRNRSNEVLIRDLTRGTATAATVP